MRTLKKTGPLLLVIALLLSTILLSGCGSGGSAAKADPYQAAIELARTEVWKDINSGKASSASVAILDNGNVVYSEGLGVADRATGVPVSARTLFNIGSVSKTFDAAALMVLVDEGKVKLDAPVTQYLPEFKMADPRYKDVTVRMLLNHQSGFPGSDYANNMGYAFNKPIYEETLAVLAQSHLKAAPGATAPYCNDGFTLAEMIVARLSGQTFLDFLSNKVLKPLSLTRTGDSVGMRPDDGISRFYLADSGKIVPPEVLSVRGAGGISSTAEELVLFMDSFSKSGPHVLSDSSIAEMSKPSPSVFAKAAVKETGVNPEMTYGLGFDLTGIPTLQAQGIKVIGKGGDSDDYHSMMLAVPDKRISVAVIEAGHGSRAAEITLSMLRSVLEAKGLVKKVNSPATAPPAPQAIPAGYANLAGYYAGDTSTYKLSLDLNQNIGELTVIKNGVESSPAALAYRDGNLYTAAGGQFKLISAAGRDMLIAAVDGGYMTMGQRLTSISNPQALGTNIDGQVWLRRNVKPFEAMSATTQTHLVRSTALPGMPGYIAFYGVKKIESGNFAGMPVDAIRDLTELTLLDRNGQTWARVSDSLYSKIDTAAPVGAGQKNVTIGKDGYNEWLKTEGDLILKIVKPSKCRVVVFEPGGSVSYDSEIDQGEMFVAAGSLVELAGLPGNVLSVTATAPPGN
ncbi:MAG: serine hydrolase domain-containing protein [Candidatus Geothermincolia bacterium]